MSRLVYQPSPGLLTGGKLFRNSFCWLSASFCCSASRVCCSGLGPGLAQPNKAIRSGKIKKDFVSSFFIRRWHDDNQGDQRGNLPSEMFHGSAKPDYSTFVTSYSSTVCSRFLSSRARKRSRISFNVSSFFKFT